MKTYLKHIALLALAVPAIALANPKLVGTWKATAGSEKALSGVLELNKDGSAKLAPEGYDPLKGTWKATGPGALTLVMPPHGSSEMEYVLSKDKLTLKYNNGASQDFMRDSAEQPSTKKATKK